MTADHITSVPYQRLFQKRSKHLLKRLERRAAVSTEE
jgi:hypothetical protein